VARWDRRTDTFQQFRHDPANPDSLASDAVRTLLIDARGRIWAGTFENGLDMLDPKTGKAQHFRHRKDDPRSLAADAVFALYSDRSGRVWVGSDGGLSRYEPSTGDFINYSATPGTGLSDARVRSIREDHTGVMWIGTLGGGLNRLDPDTSRITAFRHSASDPGSLSSDRVQAILEDDANRLWVATRDGLNLFERSTGKFVRYGRDADSPQSLRDPDVMSLFQDRGGVLWVGTRWGGASHWNPNSWLLGHYRSAALSSGVGVNAFTDDGAGTVWVGTSAGLVEIDTRTGRETQHRRNDKGTLALADDNVMTLTFDRRSALWVGTMTAGLQRFELA
jgi:ligand-binding sensor domain-containing protein